MAFMLIRLNVQDYARWKPYFDEFGAVRKMNGSKGSRIFRSADNPNDVQILTEWEQMESARQVAQSEGLRQAMQRAGVNGKPEVYFLDEVDRQAA